MQGIINVVAFLATFLLGAYGVTCLIGTIGFSVQTMERPDFAGWFIIGLCSLLAVVGFTASWAIFPSALAAFQ